MCVPSFQRNLILSMTIPLVLLFLLNLCFNRMSLSLWFTSNGFSQDTICRLCTQRLRHIHKHWLYYKHECKQIPFYKCPLYKNRLVKIFTVNKVRRLMMYVLFLFCFLFICFQVDNSDEKSGE